MDIILEILKQDDAKKLYEFELENRAYFEKMVPDRGEDYYHFDTYQIRHNALLEEQRKGQAIYYLIKDKNGLIIGRMNIVDIDLSRQLGFIGYRVGEAYTGKGIASRAVQLLLSIIDRQSITQISAKTTTDNIASQRVLEKNGFEYISTSNQEFNINGKSVKFIYYKWTV
ncbi:GNAT family N-acetyltransferase [Alkalihalobacillus oceani]|uniref:GNAT family N-acetyltransferase n=1 Tax=Halalkalibacter oceani TaxID=1653776 RepID=A0A9X2IPD6_9BACI|nr:GNAT family protein [Halalkalibacter oceani]MCM3714726.1 GNAT family N-acetyltransferase [Halalkalibacter oceani]